MGFPQKWRTIYLGLKGDQEMTIVKNKMYSVILKYGTCQKSVYLEGEDSEQGKNNFERIILELEEVGESSKDLPDYISNAIRHFSQNGFKQIRK